MNDTTTTREQAGATPRGGPRPVRRMFDGRTALGRRVTELLALLGGAAALPGVRAAAEELAYLEDRLAALETDARARGLRTREAARRRIARILERRTELYRSLGLGSRRRR